MQIKSFVFNSFYENTYLLIGASNSCYIVDPGCYESYERSELTSYIEKNELNPLAVLNTHCHIDHVLGNAYLCEKYDIPLWIPEGELEMLRSMEVYAPTWGVQNFETKSADRLLLKDERLDLDGESLDMIYAPGHSPGHLMFLCGSDLIAGDVIFRESVGRTDLPGGSFETLEASIKNEVYTLNPEVTIYPGHGPTTTVGHEQVNNPFVKK